jgi:Trk K+ transport system NAD-binding subunit
MPSRLGEGFSAWCFIGGVGLMLYTLTTVVQYPSQETLIEFGDELVIIGTRKQLRALEGSA